MMGGMLKWFFNTQNPLKTRMDAELARWEDEDKLRGNDKFSALTSDELSARIALLQSFLQRLTPDGEDMDAYCEKNYPHQIGIAAKMLESLGYSEELKAFFKDRVRQAFLNFDEDDIKRQIEDYPHHEPHEREAALQGFCDKIFASFQEDFEELQTPQVRLSSKFKEAYGWVYVDAEQILKGKFRPIYMQSDNPGLFQDLHTISHEATHHLMQQLVSLSERGKVSFSNSFTQDLENRFEQVRRNAFGLPGIKRLYHADPDEQLAFHSGYRFQYLHTAHHNSGDMAQTLTLLDNMDKDIQALARGDKLPAIDDIPSPPNRNGPA